MTKLIAPQAGERCNDPACGTFGFMIAADKFVKDKKDDLFDLSLDEQIFQKTEAFTGCELVHDTHRLALMNAMLHDIEGKIILGDTLSNQGKIMKDFDVVLTNPPRIICFVIKFCTCLQNFFSLTNLLWDTLVLQCSYRNM
jgi:type I restriction enzyme M protein